MADFDRFHSVLRLKHRGRNGTHKKFKVRRPKLLLYVFVHVSVSFRPMFRLVFAKGA
jgi:hypothetical protein